MTLRGGPTAFCREAEGSTKNAKEKKEKWEREGKRPLTS